MIYDELIDNVVTKTKETMRAGHGGPFGAAVFNSETGEVICISSNSVLKDNDPTAHAEINAIREACKILKTHDLTGYSLYATGYPCPMCLSAIIWANIKTVFYSTDVKDAEEIGFRDDFIYRFIHNGNSDKSIMNIFQVGRCKCKEMFDEYKVMGEIY